MFLYDFHIFYQGALLYRIGVSPYTVFDFNAPATMALLFVPFSFLPVSFAYITYVIINLFLLWKLTDRRIIWPLLSFPVLFMLFVGQVDFMLVALASLSPFALPLLLAKPQVAIVVLPWVMLHMTRRGWLQAGISTILFVGMSLAIRPTWVAEYLSTAPAASNYLIRSSSMAYLLPNGDIRLIGTVILAILGVALSLRARSRRHSQAIMQLFQPLSNIYSPSVLAEWIGLREVIFSCLSPLSSSPGQFSPMKFLALLTHGNLLMRAGIYILGGRGKGL